jgi:sugar lactone lactonase YvrE
MKAAQSGFLAAALLVLGCSQNSGGDGVAPGTGGTSAGGSGGKPAGSGGSGGALTGSGGANAGSGGTPTGNGGSSTGSGGSATDTAASDTGGAPDTGAPPAAACGMTPAAFVPAGTGRTEGLVVGPDGTVYFSDFGTHVGRYAPPYDKAPEKTWATIPGATILGITYDPKKKAIYAGSRTTKMLYKIDATDPTKVTPIVAVEAGFNGITLDEDGAIFYTDQGGGGVYRVTPDDMKKAMVSKTPVADANGIAFGPPPERQLYVLGYGSGNITRLKLENNVETSRELFVKLPKGSADGIAFDKAGNLYATAGALWKVTPDKMTTMVNATGGANVEFGVGALSCKDVLWAGSETRKVSIDTEGMDVPWHRP